MPDEDQGSVYDKGQGSASHWGWGSGSLLLPLKGSCFWASLEAPGLRGYCSHPLTLSILSFLGLARPAWSDERTHLGAELLPEISCHSRPHSCPTQGLAVVGIQGRLRGSPTAQVG